MRFSVSEALIMVLAVAFGAMIMRILPFLLFPEHKKTPEYIIYLGKVLPAAVMGLLVIYCLKGISITKSPYGIPEMLGVIGIIGLHKWKHNTLLSIGGGTMLYMILVQFVFT